MPRYKLTLEYDGTPFVGWQKQQNGLSIQEALEKAILEFSQETVSVQGAGRTDAGVHAKGQVGHFDLVKEFKSFQVMKGLNFYLKRLPISILAVERVDESFDARFSAKKREYLYRIINRPAPLALDLSRAWWIPSSLNVKRMQEAAHFLEGTHDFTTFRSIQCQSASPLKTVDELRVSRFQEEIHIAVKARSFLHHQVRNFVGTLKYVGEGKWTPDDILKALKAKDRSQGGPTAPPWGLYFMKVIYEENPSSLYEESSLSLKEEKRIRQNPPKKPGIIAGTS